MTSAGAGRIDPEHAHAVGTLADEAASLLDAVAARLARTRSSPHGSDAGPGADAGPGVDEGDRVDEDHRVDAPAPVSCVGWCPVCRSAELLQGDRPELTEKLVDAALLVVATLRSLIPPPPAPDGAAEPKAGPGGTSTRSTGPGLERIDIR